MTRGVKGYKSTHVADYRRDNALDCSHNEKIYIKGFFSRHKAVFGFGYRCDPVPFTGVQRNHYGRYFRRPKTTQERKINCGHLLEGIRIRGRRRPHILTDYFDDVYIGNIGCKSWKHQSRKKKQWM